MQPPSAPPKPMRLALLTMEALANAAAVRRFVATWHDSIALVALSDPFRPQRGGTIAQMAHLLSRSGPRLLPYLAANFALPRIAGAVAATPPVTADPARIPLRTLCARLGIAAETIADMNALPFHARLRGLGIDAILTFHCDQILSAATLAIPPRGGLNVHPGLLPEHRGPTPTLHALLEAAPRFGLTLHRLTPRIDAGAVLAREEVTLPTGISGLAAAEALHLAALALLDRVLPAFLSGTAEEVAMPHAPYRSFPSAAEMRQIARLGHHAVDWADLERGLRTPV